MLVVSMMETHSLRLSVRFWLRLFLSFNMRQARGMALVITSPRHATILIRATFDRPQDVSDGQVCRIVLCQLSIKIADLPVWEYFRYIKSLVYTDW